MAFITLATVLAITVTAPTNAQVLSSPALTVTWTDSGGTGTQTSYRVQIFSDAGGTVQVYDSGTVVSAVRSCAVPANCGMLNASSYWFKVTETDTTPVTAASVLVPVTTSWTPPATISGLTLTKTGGT